MNTTSTPKFTKDMLATEAGAERLNREFLRVYEQLLKLQGASGAFAIDSAMTAPDVKTPQTEVPADPKSVVNLAQVRKLLEGVTAGDTIIRYSGGGGGGGATYGYTVEALDGDNAIAPNAGVVCHEVTLDGLVTINDPTNVVAGKPLILIVVQNGTTAAPKPIFGAGYLNIPEYDVSPVLSSVMVFFFVGRSGGSVLCIDIWQGYKAHQLTMIPSANSSAGGRIGLQAPNGDEIGLKAPAVVDVPYDLSPPSKPATAINQVLAAKDTSGQTKWITVSTGGAPNTPNDISGASFTVLYGLWANSAAFLLMGTIALPSDRTYLDRIRIDLIGPSPYSTMQSFYVDGPFPTTTATFNILPGPGTLRTTSSQSFTIRFTAEASGTNQESNPYTTTFTVDSAAVTGVSLAEYSGGRANLNGTASTKLRLTVSLAGAGPVRVALRYNRNNGLGWYDVGVYEISSSGASIETDWVPVPSQGTTNWIPAAEPLLGLSGVSSLSGFLEPTLTSTWVTGGATGVSSVGATAATILTNASIHQILYSPNKSAWGFDYITWNVDTTSPQMYSMQLRVQKGHVSLGSFTPATDYEGAERDFATIRFDGSGDGTMVVTGTVGTAKVIGSANWGNPATVNDDGSPNVDRVFRFTLWGGSVEGASEVGGGTGATWTKQTTAWGGADHFDVTPDAPGNWVDGTKIMTYSLGTSLAKDPVTKKIYVSSVNSAQVASVSASVIAAVANSADIDIDPFTGFLRINTLNLNRLVGNTATFAGNVTISAGGSLIIAGGGGVQISHNGRTSSFTATGFDLSWGIGYLGSLACTGGATFASNSASIDNSGNGYFPNIYNKATVDSLLSGYLTTSAASSTYETQAHASSTYMSVSTGDSRYYTQSAADSRFMPAAGPSWGITDSHYIVGGDGWVHVMGFSSGILSSSSTGT